MTTPYPDSAVEAAVSEGARLRDADDGDVRSAPGVGERGEGLVRVFVPDVAISSIEDEFLYGEVGDTGCVLFPFTAGTVANWTFSTSSIGISSFFFIQVIIILETLLPKLIILSLVRKNEEAILLRNLLSLL